METRIALWGGVLPGAVVFLGLVLAWRALGKRGAGPRWTAPALFAVAFAVADWVAHGAPDLWPRDVTYRFMHAAAALLLAGVVESQISRPAIARHIVRAAALAVVSWMFLEGWPRWGAAELAAWTAGAAGASVLLVAVVDRICEARPGWTGPALLVIPAAGAMPTLFFGKYATGAQLAAGLVAIAAGASIAGVVAPSQKISRGGALVFGGLFFSIVLTGLFYAELPWASAALLLASPLAAPLGRLGPMKKRRPWVRGLAQAILVAAPVIAAAIIAHELQPSYEPYEY